MDTHGALRLLADTRRLTISVVVLLSVQLFGNLYEQLVSNVQTYAAPTTGAVSELAAGSPLFFYMPWVPIGLVLAVMLTVRLHKAAPGKIARRARSAMGWLAVAVVAKAYLISQVNGEFRRTDISLDEIRSLAVIWGIANGIAIVAVAVALVLLTSWRSRVLDTAVAREPVRDPAGA